MRHLLLATAFLLIVFTIGGCKERDPQNVPEMKEKLVSKVNMALWKVDATKAQRMKMDHLLDGLAPDLFAFQQEDKAIQRSIIEALHANPVDQPQLEAMQKKGLDLFDRYTLRLVVAAMDTSAILNLGQRRELLDLWRKWEFGE